MNFKCSWDATVTSTTVTDGVIEFVVMILCLAGAIYYWKKEEKETFKAWVCLLISILLLVGFCFTVIFCPLSVSVKNESIYIHRIKSDIVIPFNEIEEIRMCMDSDLESSRRDFGSGGSFGYLGKFSNQKLGKYQMYATDNSKLILVKNKKEEYLIFSCDKPDELIEIVNQGINDF